MTRKRAVNAFNELVFTLGDAGLTKQLRIALTSFKFFIDGLSGSNTSIGELGEEFQKYFGDVTDLFKKFQSAGELVRKNVDSLVGAFKLLVVAGILKVITPTGLLTRSFGLLRKDMRGTVRAAAGASAAFLGLARTEGVLQATNAALNISFKSLTASMWALAPQLAAVGLAAWGIYSAFQALKPKTDEINDSFETMETLTGQIDRRVKAFHTFSQATREETLRSTEAAFRAAKSSEVAIDAEIRKQRELIFTLKETREERIKQANKQNKSEPARQAARDRIIKEDLDRAVELSNSIVQLTEKLFESRQAGQLLGDQLRLISNITIAGRQLDELDQLENKTKAQIEAQDSLNRAIASWENELNGSVERVAEIEKQDLETYMRSLGLETTELQDAYERLNGTFVEYRDNSRKLQTEEVALRELRKKASEGVRVEIANEVQTVESLTKAIELNQAAQKAELLRVDENARRTTALNKELTTLTGSLTEVQQLENRRVKGLNLVNEAIARSAMNNSQLVFTKAQLVNIGKNVDRQLTNEKALILDTRTSTEKYKSAIEFLTEARRKGMTTAEINALLLQVEAGMYANLKTEALKAAKAILDFSKSQTPLAKGVQAASRHLQNQKRNIQAQIKAIQDLLKNEQALEVYLIGRQKELKGAFDRENEIRILREALEQLGLDLQNLNNDISGATDEIKFSAKLMEEAWIGAIRSIQDTFSDFFYDMGQGFDTLLDNLLDSFRRTLADMASAALTQKIIIPIATSVAGAVGGNIFGGAVQSAAGGAVGSAAAGAAGGLAANPISSALGGALGGTGLLGLSGSGLGTAFSAGFSNTIAGGSLASAGQGGLALTGSGAGQAAGFLGGIAAYAGGLAGGYIWWCHDRSDAWCC